MIRYHREIYKMLIGYARTSNIIQQAGFEAQLVELKAYGCERTYKEQVSAVATRAELDAAIDRAVEASEPLFVSSKVVRGPRQ